MKAHLVTTTSRRMESSPVVSVRLMNLRRLSRRTFLRVGGVCLGLPMLEAMCPIRVRAVDDKPALMPRRLMLIGRGLGAHAENFFPAGEGMGYKARRTLQLLENHRSRLTVFSGLSHPGYPNTHFTEAGLFTAVGAERIERFEQIRNSVSLDQHVAAHWAKHTRIASLVMGGFVTTPMSYDAQGTPVPSERNPAAVFRRLFLSGTPRETELEIHRLSQGWSILDRLVGQLKSLGSRVGTEDRDQLEIMATTIRQAEQELELSKAWVKAPKPRPPAGTAADDFENPTWSTGQRMRYDLAFLAFQTDSTRVAVSTEGPGFPGDAAGAVLGQHDASHHGQDASKLEQYYRYEDEETRNLAGFLDRLSQAREAGEPLMDRTAVLWASNLGNPSSHSSENLPVLLAGGGFEHGGHVVAGAAGRRDLGSLYLRMLAHLGIDTKTFGASSEMMAAWR
ncbi:MAG: DUF1552 domain-containing protein [Verrucomicrobia bacterium]|nr:DUF1552 domain-containing protein [Verrucomicrobiota bacterium]